MNAKAALFTFGCLGLVGLAHGIDRGAPLPRKGFFGIASSAAKNGVQITRIVPGGTGEKMGLTTGDVIVSLNGQHLANPAEFVAFARKVNAGTRVDIRYARGGKEASAIGSLVERPRQTESELDVVYDQVISQGKRIRVIITKPRGAGRFPALFLIGGIGGYSLDAPFSTMLYGMEIGPIAHKGYVTVRIDKPGQGDSEGPEYKNLTFNVEKDAYLQALRLTKTLDYVDPNKIAIFGHSMGGCFAPLVASEEPVKAVIVSGTLFKPFVEYMLENSRRQSELTNTPEEELDESQKQFAETMHYLFGVGDSPSQAVRKHPEIARFVKENLPDGQTYSGVGIPFFRELSKTNLPKAWSAVNAQVMAVYCENDFLSGQDDHQRIADFVNGKRPGTAQFKVLKNSDHLFSKTTSMRDSMDKFGKGGEFNPSIVDTLLDFLQQKVA